MRVPDKFRRWVGIPFAIVLATFIIYLGHWMYSVTDQRRHKNLRLELLRQAHIHQRAEGQWPERIESTNRKASYELVQEDDEFVIYQYVYRGEIRGERRISK